jgi:hypothetical protein
MTLSEVIVLIYQEAVDTPERDLEEIVNEVAPRYGMRTEDIFKEMNYDPR